MVYSAVSTGSWRLAGRVAIVTGGAKGLGFAAAERLVGEGARVLIADVDGNAAAAAAEKMPGAVGIHADVTNPEAMEALARKAAMDYGGGRLDIVVNNAGVVSPVTPIHKYPLEEWRRVLDVNLNGAFFTLRAALGQMTRQDPSGGVIINTVSTAGLTGLVGYAPYTAAKSALVGLTRSAAVEYGAAGVRVVGVAPTGIKTPMVLRHLQDMGVQDEEIATQLIGSQNIMPGAPAPEHFGAAVAFLAGDEARFISGSVLPLDGAYLAGRRPSEGSWSLE